MSLTLSIFDIFAYAIPGSLYLTLITYISQRLGWLNLDFAKDLNTTVLFIGVGVASYLLGHISYDLGRFVDQVLPWWRKRVPDGRQEFLARVPTSKGKLLADTDPFFLQVATEVRAKEAAIDISRFRAVGIMLRNCVPALLLASAVAVAEVVLGSNRILALCSSSLLLIATLAAMHHGRVLREWAISRTLSVAFWTGVDDDLMKSIGEAAPNADPGSMNTGEQSSLD
jgi:hypothetical protein